MIEEKEYYIAPKQKIFDDIKNAAINIWKTYDDTYGYQSEKVNRIKDLTNVKDNYAYIVAMFDQQNQSRLLNAVEREETKDLVQRLIN